MTHGSQLIEPPEQLVEHLDQFLSGTAGGQASETHNISEEDANVVALGDVQVSELMELLLLVLTLKDSVDGFISHDSWEHRLEEGVLCV